jgi:starch-binding outer membrane protein, SusD/RagB family
MGNMKLKLIVILFFMTLMGCQKDYLEVRNNKSIFVPSTLEDFQNILDNTSSFSVGNTTSIIMNKSDDFYITSEAWNSLVVREKNTYIWKSVIDETNAYWLLLYQQIFYANVVLDGLEEMKGSGKMENNWHYLKGTALFYRAYAYYNLAQLYTKPYIVGMSGTDPGVPLRLTGDVDAKYPRGTVAQVYNQMINDLRESIDLLPNNTAYKTRPTKVSAHAMLARINLAIASYEEAENYVDAALKIKSVLLDYDLISSAPRRPFPLALPNNNEEIIWYTSLLGTFMRSAFTYADTTLYASYDSFDKRKSLFFLTSNNKNANFKGSYSGDNYCFSGLAVDELYLIKAECLARRGETTASMKMLNMLLVKRWVKDKFSPLQASNSVEALEIILTERRKELIGRGTRWADLRRLNQDQKYAVTQVRILNGDKYVFAADDMSKYLLLLPLDEILKFGYEQN